MTISTTLKPPPFCRSVPLHRYLLRSSASQYAPDRDMRSAETGWENTTPSSHSIPTSDGKKLDSHNSMQAGPLKQREPLCPVSSISNSPAAIYPTSKRAITPQGYQERSRAKEVSYGKQMVFYVDRGISRVEELRSLPLHALAETRRVTTRRIGYCPRYVCYPSPSRTLAVLTLNPFPIWSRFVCKAKASSQLHACRLNGGRRSIQKPPFHRQVTFRLTLINLSNKAGSVPEYNKSTSTHISSLVQM